MRKLKKNGVEVPEMNAIIYALDNERLWDHRKMFFRIREDKEYLLHLTLTKYFSTLRDMAEMLSGGVDLIYFEVSADDSEELISGIHDIVGRQEATGLILSEQDSILWEYFRKGTRLEQRYIPIKDIQDLYQMVESLCNHIVNQEND